MTDVFINYRTGDGDKSALTIERELARRFGEDRIFFASRSIRPSERFPRKLLQGVEDSAVLLAIMGPGWAQDPGLRLPGDWVRKEILTAFKHGIPVVPVLEARHTERLRAADLPPKLARLAECQSVRLDLQHNAGADLARLGDAIATLVPGLGAVDRDRASDTAKPDARSDNHNEVGRVNGPSLQAGHVLADAVHLGTGSIHHSTTHFSGDGATHVQGDNHGDIGHHFDGIRRHGEGR